ncbi:unnamed protein product [Cyprideis torosa]|uniref:COP9 signalosome complex subunit 6 n=1 Tax=Cyprideis torosa TaxID=163714 RepID=A0A7R8WMY7_9CRUS|nr:unnamed protein product [Cyprideis torosa]CAG0903419.1 unnamed protein product [Cyprideis torosa]
MKISDFVEQVEVLMANPAASQPSFAVQLHPLVIMNISDHWTRIKAQEGSSKQVLGVILGTQQGRNLEIENSFELATLEVEDQLVLDLDYLNAKEVRYKQVFPDLDVLGWYTTGTYPEPSPVDLHVHKQVLARSENPLLLKLVPMSAQHSDLPVTMYESLIDLKGSSSPRLLFLQTTYSIVTEEAERIGIDHVARMASTDAIGESSAAADPLLAQFGAIKMLHSRIKIILAFLAGWSASQVDSTVIYWHGFISSNARMFRWWHSWECSHVRLSQSTSLCPSSMLFMTVAPQLQGECGVCCFKEDPTGGGRSSISAALEKPDQHKLV